MLCTLRQWSRDETPEMLEQGASGTALGSTRQHAQNIHGAQPVPWRGNSALKTQGGKGLREEESQAGVLTLSRL